MTTDQILELIGPLPHSDVAERAVLSGMLNDAASLSLADEMLIESDFYRMDHRLIFRGIQELFGAQSACDAITVTNWFESRGLDDFVGGPSYLKQLAAMTQQSSSFRAELEIVRDKAVLRKIIESCIYVIADALLPEKRSFREIMDGLTPQIHEISNAAFRLRKGVIPIRNMMKEAFQTVHQRYENRNSASGIRSGILSLDQLTGGFQPADLIILASRPGMGKTALAMSIIHHAALVSKKSIAIFTPEMTATAFTFRLLSAVGSIDQEHLRSGNMIEKDWFNLTKTISLSMDWKIHIDDEPSMSLSELSQRAHALKRQSAIDLIVIDYVQLLWPPTNKGHRTADIVETSRGLKALARELDIPILALSQLNQTVEQRHNLRPCLSDLRGALAEVADVVLLLYREDYYDLHTAKAGRADLILEKQRNGRTGTVSLRFFPEYSRFEEFTGDSF